jgi:hypothetical protein
MTDPLGLWGWSETLTTVAAVAGIAALVATGPVALIVGGVAVVAGAGALGLDIHHGASPGVIALDIVGLVPGSEHSAPR